MSHQNDLSSDKVTPDTRFWHRSQGEYTFRDVSGEEVKGVNIVSWNGRRISSKFEEGMVQEGRIFQALSELGRLNGTFILCLQESQLVTESLEGWHFVSQMEKVVDRNENVGRAMGCVPQKLKPLIRAELRETYNDAVVIGRLGVIASYLPNSSKSLPQYLEGIAQLQKIITTLRVQHHIRWLAVGADAQVQLPPDIKHMTGPSVFRTSSNPQEAVRRMIHEERNDMIARQGILMELLKKNNLKAVNTWLKQEQVYTFKNAQGHTSQIDYVFASRSSYTKAHVHNEAQFMRSDHFPISVYMRALPKRKKETLS